MEQLDLHALADFVLVATQGGFGKAGRATGRSKATLSRRVADLEKGMGVRLLERGQTTLRLTAAGEALLLRARGPLDELVQAGDDIRNGAGVLAGPLRISAPVLFAHTMLGQLAAEFMGLHPAVEIEINAENRIVDLVEEGYDLVVRVNPAATETLVGRRFLRDQVVVVAAPQLLRPKDTSELVPAVVLSRSSAATHWVVGNGGEERRYAIKPVLRLSSLIMSHQAVRAGAGAAALPLSLVAEDLATGALVSWGDLANQPVDLWALHASRRLASPKVQAFVQFLVDRFEGGMFSIPPAAR